ncbi:MAG TPA: hypothetical protein VGJ02_07965 [Pyrinomonadaceae bacterium]|jgi:hypothetical protein
MKICPRCQRTYTDDNLNFCLDDGVVLQQAGGAAEPPATVFMNQPPPTNPQVAQLSQPVVQPAWNTAPQPQFGAPVKKKSSKAWIWAVLILGAVVILCGGGLVGLFVYIASQSSTPAVVSNTTVNAKTTTGNKTTTSNSIANTFGNTSTTSTDPSRTSVQDIDLQDWVRDKSTYGVTEFTNGEFFMASKEKGYYYVLVAPEDYSTENANTRVTLRNVDNMDSRYGYGLIFHSNPSPLIQDYAFLINTKTKKYRVVRHEPTDEKTVVAWTNSAAIKDGAQENVLEARDKEADGKVELYINGQLVTTIPSTYGYKGGVPGLYAGDAAKIGFKNLQIAK